MEVHRCWVVNGSRRSAVGIATELRVGATGVRIPVGKRDMHFQNVHTVSGAQRPFYSIGTRVFCPEVKRSGRETDHLRPSSFKVKNESR